jgi:hypothetical protein
VHAMGMKRKFGFAAAWVGATIISLVIASAAVAGIRDRVEDSPVAAGIPTTLDVVADTTSTTDAGVVTTTELPDTSSSSTSSTTTSSSTTTTSEAPVSTTNAPGGSTTTSSTTTTTSAPPPTTVASQTKTYELIGGTVTVRIGSGTVELVSLAPKTGFASKIKDDGPDKVKVTFTSNTHESKFEAEFEDGEYEFKIDEEPIGEDDD